MCRSSLAPERRVKAPTLQALTELFILLSAWWVKSLVFIAAGLVHDLRRRILPPLTMLTVAAAFGLASLASAVLKEVFDRPRPQGANLIALPESASFPSGHATTAFGAAVALVLLWRAAAVWALPLAALVAYSRVELGVHHWTDIIAGALVGTVLALVVVGAVRRRPSGPWARSRTRPP